MLRLLFLCALLIVSFATCKSHKNSTTEDKSTSETLVVAKDTLTIEKTSAQRFIISFYSIGSGAEGKQIEKLNAFVAEYEKQSGKKISFSIVPWGREGERDYCFPLRELSAKQQKQFISGVKDVLQTAQWVHYSENVPCRK